MKRGRLLTTAAGAAVLIGAAVLLRSGVPAPVQAAVGPNGERINAYHDPALVTPPRPPDGRPQQPGRLSTDVRRNGFLVSWPPAPYAFEVRWERAGAEPGADRTAVRYVATPSTSVARLSEGRYRVEVRSVDDIGRRSEPSTTEVEVNGDVPEWQRGLGFVEDFTAGAALAPDRWRVHNVVRECVRREGGDGPLLLDGQCAGALRPVSPLVLADPDRDGVRGRVVVVADAPPPLPAPAGGGEPPPDEFGVANALNVLVTPVQSVGEVFSGVRLRISSGGASLTIGAAMLGWPREERQLAVPPVGSPGALHRWELVFTGDEVRALRDGVQVGSLGYRPPWRAAEVELAASVATAGVVPVGSRIGLVGLTGPVPDGVVVEQVDVTAGTEQPAAVRSFQIPIPQTVRSARLSGFAFAAPVDAAGRPPTPDIAGEIDGRPFELRRQPPGGPDEYSLNFTAELPLDRPGPQLDTQPTVTLRSADGTPFVAFGIQLELTHRPGTAVGTPRPRVTRPGPPSLPQPRLSVRQGQRVLVSGENAARGRLDVEVRLESVAAQAVTGELAGCVAVRVRLGDRRLLDVPTVADGPAIAGSHRFTVDTTSLPGGEHRVTVEVVPDRPGLPYSTDGFVIALRA